MQTSNASFIFTDQVEQQFAMTRARAIESGRYVAVASTNGISGVIAPDGEVVDRTDRMTRDVIVETVDLKSGADAGNPGQLGVSTLSPAFMIIGLLLGLRGYRRRHVFGPGARTSPARGDGGPDL